MHPPAESLTKAQRYFRETGELFQDAIRRLAKTHNKSRAAIDLGMEPGEMLRWMRYRGIKVEFRPGRSKFIIDGITGTLKQHGARLGRSATQVFTAVARYRRQHGADAELRSADIFTEQRLITDAEIDKFVALVSQGYTREAAAKATGFSLDTVRRRLKKTHPNLQLPAPQPSRRAAQRSAT